MRQKTLQKREQISLVLRYYYNGTVHESFMDFEHADRLDAAGLTEKIVKSIQKYGLEHREQLEGQGYDAASVMSGRHNGVASKIKSQAKHAFYVHCSCLNLVIVDSAVPEASCFFYLCCNACILSCLGLMYTRSGWTYSIQCFRVSLESHPSSVMWGGLADSMPVETWSDGPPTGCSVYPPRNWWREYWRQKCRGTSTAWKNRCKLHCLLATFRRILGDTKLLSNLLKLSTLDLDQLTWFGHYRTHLCTIERKHVLESSGWRCRTLLRSATLA